MAVGHIKIDRKILEWEWYKDLNVFKLFTHLLIKANYKDGNWKNIQVKRGQFVTGRFELSKETGLSEQEIRTAIKKLLSTSEITIKSTNKNSIITICKYDTYQSKKDDTNQQNNQQNVIRATTTNNNKEYNIINKDITHTQEEIFEIQNSSIFNIQGFIRSKMPEDVKILKEKELETVAMSIRANTTIFLEKEIIIDLYNAFVAEQMLADEYCKSKGDFIKHFINTLKSKGKELSKLVLKPLTESEIKKIANKVWVDKNWLKSCLENHEFKNDNEIKSAMQRFNSSICNEKHSNFDSNDYKLRFIRWHTKILKNGQIINNKNEVGVPLLKL